MISYTQQLQDINIVAWIFENSIKTERSLPISFESHPFMLDPYLDWTPEQGVRKASQCGWSVMTNLKLFYSAKYGIPEYGVPAANVIYTLPTDADVNTFVPSKTNLLIRNNPIILEYLTGEEGKKADVDSIQRKRIANSMVYFKGTRSKTAALMLSSDLNIHDEADRSERSIIEEYASRVASSKYKGRWVFSNPSAPNMPADQLYADSDQKYWFVRCGHCGHWQYLDWFKLSEFEFKLALHCYVDDKNNQFVCGKCCRPLDQMTRKRGMWVKRYAGRAASGYWISHMMYPWMTPLELINVEKNKSKQYFMNFVRGLPYIGSDTVVDSRVIVNNIVLTQVDWVKGQVAMGVDNGDTKHYVIGNKDGIFACGKTKSWDDIERLIQKYEPVTVIDLNPYPAIPRELAAKYRPTEGRRWRVYCSFYILRSADWKLIEWGTGDKMHMVYPVRDLLLDELVEYISNGNLKFFAAKPYWEEYITHWESMYRSNFIGTRRADDVGFSSPREEARSAWLSSTGNDHYAHATLYFYVALSRIVQGAGKVLQSDQSRNIAQAAGVRSAPVVHDGKMEPMTKYLDIRSMLQKKSSGALSDKK